jgi:hypothetical protein
MPRVHSASFGPIPPGNYALVAVATDDDGATNTSAAINLSISNNVRPSVTLTSPTNNALFAAPATISLNATATDVGGGTITKVEFFEGANKIGEDTTSPHSFAWTNVAAGNYQLTALATDNGGLISTSAVVNVNVVNNQAPLVSISSPTNGATFVGPTNISVVAAPTDDGNITRVEFFQNGSKIGERSAVPYSLTWSNVAVGLYSLTAVVTDNLAAKGTSAPVTITVQSGVPSSSWVAFNDHAPGGLTHVNTTIWNVLGDAPGSTGSLKNITNGSTLPVTLTITRSGSVQGGGLTDYPSAGTPAYNTFNGFVDFVGSPNPAIQVPAGSLVTYTFTGLDPAKRYSFKGSAVRGGSGSNYTNRWTEVEIVGAASFTSAHTANVVTSAQAPADLTPNQVAVNFAVNFLGDMVDWENIDPGADGSIAITCTQYFGFVPGGSSTANAPPYGYGISAVRLQEFGTSSQFLATITSPGNNSTFFAPTDVRIDASAIRTPGSIAKVEFFQANTKLGEDTTSPYSLTWSNVPPGSYALKGCCDRQRKRHGDIVRRQHHRDQQRPAGCGYHIADKQ